MMASSYSESPSVVDLTQDVDEDDRKIPARKMRRSAYAYKSTLAWRSYQEEEHSSMLDTCDVGREDNYHAEGRLTRERKTMERPQAEEGDSMFPKKTRSCYDCRSACDAELAASLQREEESVRLLSLHQEETDSLLAAALQREEAESVAKAKKDADEQMLRTPTGKAFSLVEQVLTSVPTQTKGQDTSFTAGVVVSSASMNPISGSNNILLAPVSRDDMVTMAEKLFRLQDEFKNNGINSHVDVCYHYTRENCVANIQAHGLLTPEELAATKLGNSMHGATFGPGIYTGNNPFAFRAYGDVGEWWGGKSG
jgi:hypothetical protein